MGLLARRVRDRVLIIGWVALMRGEGILDVNPNPRHETLRTIDQEVRLSPSAQTSVPLIRARRKYSVKADERPRNRYIVWAI